MTRTSISIDMAAPARRIFELCGQIDQWAQLLPHYRDVHVDERRGDHLIVTMEAIRPFGPVRYPVRWRAEHWTEDDPAGMRLRFRHIAGPTKGMDVTWFLRPTPAGTRVTIEHDLRRPLPVAGERPLPWLVDRLFIRHIASRTLRRFKALAESGGAPL